MKKFVPASTQQTRLKMKLEKLRELTDQRLDQVAGGFPTDHCRATKPC